MYSDAGILYTFNSASKLYANNNVLFINTWVGAYKYHFKRHSNYGIIYNKIIEDCFYNCKSFTALDLIRNPDAWWYIPQIDYCRYPTVAKSLNFIRACPGYKVLICNNDVHSEQSSMGDMSEVVNALAEMFPQIVFVVTKQFATTHSNIAFTNNIFQEDHDLVEISYLSHHCDLIVGKNSGAFTYSNTKNNLLNASKTFVCFSHHAEDTLPYGLDIKAGFHWTDITDTQASVNYIKNLIGR